jgi:CRISPR system Cascade subunit CasA
MSLNYLTSHYLRVRRADGRVDYAAPAEIAATGDGAPVAFATGLPLLDAFATELVIGLFQYAVAPEGDRDLIRLIRGDRPAVDELHARLADVSDGFDLHGETPAFQDPSVAGEKPSPVGRLLPTTAGEQTRKRNQDILNPEFGAMRPEIAMLALAFVQAHSPAGGRGTRTSLAGGGPLRTWVVRDSLYDTVIANLLPQRHFRALGTPGGDGLDPLPWRAAVKGVRASANTPPEHVYFACPRRILLAEPEPADPARACDATGETDVPLITAILQKAEGPDYDSSSWRHPLTPYAERQQKGVTVTFPKLAATLALGTGWRERAGLFGDRQDGKTGTTPAQAVRWFRDRCVRYLPQPVVRVRAFGLRCDNAKVESVVDVPFTFRALPSDDTPAIKRFEDHLGAIVAVAERMADALYRCLREALHGPDGAKDLPRDWGREHQTAFWQRTESDFDRYVADLAGALAEAEDVGDALKTTARQRARRSLQWRLRATALAIFDEICAPGLDGAHALDISRARVRLEKMTSSAAGRGVDPEAVKEAEPA